MKLEELTTIEQLSQFLEGAQAVIFMVNTLKEERHQWVQHELIRFDFRVLNKVKKGVVIGYLIKVSGYSSSIVIPDILNTTTSQAMDLKVNIPLKILPNCPYG